ncbi:unnamed protein product [Parnassius apollo]|uniref:(apollo) hypothetical protein n=1 Tax=Parnassius apollo TaxID=110799 RepID=A0A8S3VZ67_PARAO|nr:unnamed protein product [Parnassius apollo]
MNAFVTVLAVVIVAVAAETRDKRGLVLASPYLSAYNAAPLLSSHTLLGAHSLYSSPYLAGSPYLSASSLYSPLYGSYYSPSLYGAPYLTSNALYGAHGPLLTSLSSPLISAHSSPVIIAQTSPEVTVVKTSSEEHSSAGHRKHETEHKSVHHNY